MIVTRGTRRSPGSGALGRARHDHCSPPAADSRQDRVHATPNRSAAGSEVRHVQPVNQRGADAADRAGDITLASAARQHPDRPTVIPPASNPVHSGCGRSPGSGTPRARGSVRALRAHEAGTRLFTAIGRGGGRAAHLAWPTAAIGLTAWPGPGTAAWDTRLTVTSCDQSSSWFARRAVRSVWLHLRSPGRECRARTINMWVADLDLAAAGRRPVRPHLVIQAPSQSA